jgi:hypothetical protein
MLIFHSEFYFASIIVFSISRIQLCYRSLYANCIKLTNTNVVYCLQLVTSRLKKKDVLYFLGKISPLCIDLIINT